MAVPMIDDYQTVDTHDVPQHQVVIHGGMDQVPGQHLRPLHQRQHLPILWVVDRFPIEFNSSFTQAKGRNLLLLSFFSWKMLKLRYRVSLTSHVMKKVFYPFDQLRINIVSGEIFFVRNFGTHKVSTIFSKFTKIDTGEIKFQ